jgi:hypothetical protein
VDDAGAVRADVAPVPLAERWTDDVTALVAGSDVLRFTRLPERPSEGFAARGWS